jgi:hypothetical protein
MATNPGNGKTSPFGNGSGQAGGSKVAGNNFLTNPRGSGATSGGRRFDNQVAAPQAKRESVADRNSTDAASGGLLPLVQAGPNHDVGVGSIGNGAKPFRVGG